MQQYHKGDKIRIVKVGHPLWEGDKVYDMRPQDVGREAEIQGSYDDLYPNPDRVQNGPIGYSIKWLDTGTTGAHLCIYRNITQTTVLQERQQ